MTRLLLLVLLAGVLGALGCGNTGVICTSSEVRCGNTCANFQSDPLHCGGCGTTCPTDFVCQSGQCVCPSGIAGITACGQACVNLTNSSANCGACGNACPTNQVCVNGACGQACPPGSILCGTDCVASRYPFPRTVSRIRGSSALSRSFSRNRTTCMSMVRVRLALAGSRQTRVSNSSRETARSVFVAR